MRIAEGHPAPLHSAQCSSHQCMLRFSTRNRFLAHCDATWSDSPSVEFISSAGNSGWRRLQGLTAPRSPAQSQPRPLLQNSQRVSGTGNMPPAFLLASSFAGCKLQVPFAVQERGSTADASSGSPGVLVCQQKEKDHNASRKVRNDAAPTKLSRRETILRSSSSALLLAFLNFGGERPEYLGVQSNPPSLALCPPTPGCISTSEELNDPTHYVPPWTYNPKDGRGRKNPASKDKAMAELIDVIKTTKPDNFSPKIVKQTDDYVYVEYSSPLIGFVDDVEFWFPPDNRSLVEYRSASRREGIDFGFNRKRIKAIRQALERYGWESIGF